MSLAVASPKELLSEEKPQKSLNEKQQVSGLLTCRMYYQINYACLITLDSLNSEVIFVRFYPFSQENQDLLIKCISQDLGFSGGKPIAACLIYKCLLHWRSFEVERTSVFDRIIQTIASAIEVESFLLEYCLSLQFFLTLCL